MYSSHDKDRGARRRGGLLSACCRTSLSSRLGISGGSGRPTSESVDRARFLLLGWRRAPGSGIDFDDLSKTSVLDGMQGTKIFSFVVALDNFFVVSDGYIIHQAGRWRAKLVLFLLWSCALSSESIWALGVTNDTIIDATILLWQYYCFRKDVFWKFDILQNLQHPDDNVGTLLLFGKRTNIDLLVLRNFTIGQL